MSSFPGYHRLLRALTLASSLAIFSIHLMGQQPVVLKDPSQFKQAANWKIVSDVSVDPSDNKRFVTKPGSGVWVNTPGKDAVDLITTSEYGDVELSLDFMMAAESNSGVYLLGRYEVQLLDSWKVANPGPGDNGAIYSRWDERTSKGYDEHPPRVNASRAPGLWQHLVVSFRAPAFDASGKKTRHAIMRKVVLNGAVVQENVTLFGPTRGGFEGEKATGPLRLQGDHGAVAFRNIRLVTPTSTAKNNENTVEGETANEEEVPGPIYVSGSSNPVLRSFIDLPQGKRVPHAVSVSSPQNIHYSYDMDHGMVIQLWRGGFLDATRMWYNRGDGSTVPMGAPVYFGAPSLAVAMLKDNDSQWPADTTGTGYRPKGYRLYGGQQPVFMYDIFDTRIRDSIVVMPENLGITRFIRPEKAAAPRLFLRVASGKSIEEASPGLFTVDDKSYFLRMSPGQPAPVLRSNAAGKELIVPVGTGIQYSIIF